MSKEKALKRINEYLAKQEPEKIELGILSQIESQTGKADSLLKSSKNAARKSINSSITDLNSSEMRYEIVIASYKDALGQIKAIDSDLAAGWQKKNNGILNYAEQTIKTISRLKKELKQVLTFLK